MVLVLLVLLLLLLVLLVLFPAVLDPPLCPTLLVPEEEGEEEEEEEEEGEGRGSCSRAISLASCSICFRKGAQKYKT